MKPWMIGALAALALAVVVLVNSAFVVNETQQAMVLSFGKIDRLEAEPGLKFKIPVYQQVMYFDKRILFTDSSPEEIQTRDKKRLVVDSFTRWRIVDAKKFFETLRTEQAARGRLNTIVNSNIKRMLAQKTLQNVVSGARTGLMEDIRLNAQTEMEPFGIEVVDVRIKRSDLPEANSRAVFNRMKAEREKEAKEIRAQGAEEAQKIRAEAEKERTILLAEANRDAEKIRGEGDAEAIKITGTAFNKDSDFFRFTRSLQAYRNSLSSGDTLMVLDPEVEFLKTFNEGMQRTGR